VMMPCLVYMQIYISNVDREISNWAGEQHEVLAPYNG
jgi:hypothetical protein